MTRAHLSGFQLLLDKACKYILIVKQIKLFIIQLWNAVCLILMILKSSQFCCSISSQLAGSSIRWFRCHQLTNRMVISGKIRNYQTLYKYYMKRHTVEAVCSLSTSRCKASSCKLTSSLLGLAQIVTCQEWRLPLPCQQLDMYVAAAVLSPAAGWFKYHLSTSARALSTPLIKTDRSRVSPNEKLLPTL